MIVAATGHRPDKLGGYGDDVFRRLVLLATNYLAEKQPSGVISGMALGWDQAFAHAAVTLGVPIHAAVPFVGQQSQWPATSQHRFNWLLERAVSVTIVCEGSYAPWKMQERNKWMVERCNVLAALWDGTSGGTGNCGIGG